MEHAAVSLDLSDNVGLTATGEGEKGGVQEQGPAVESPETLGVCVMPQGVGVFTGSEISMWPVAEVWRWVGTS